MHHPRRIRRDTRAARWKPSFRSGRLGVSIAINRRQKKDWTTEDTRLYLLSADISCRIKTSVTRRARLIMCGGNSRAGALICRLSRFGPKSSRARLEYTERSGIRPFQTDQTKHKRHHSRDCCRRTSGQMTPSASQIPNPVPTRNNHVGAAASKTRCFLIKPFPPAFLSTPTKSEALSPS